MTRRHEHPAFLTVHEFANLLRVSRFTVYDAVKAGQIKAIHVGRAVRIPREEVTKWASSEE